MGQSAAAEEMKGLSGIVWAPKTAKLTGWTANIPTKMILSQLADDEVILNSYWKNRRQET